MEAIDPDMVSSLADECMECSGRLSVPVRECRLILDHDSWAIHGRFMGGFMGDSSAAGG
jgi:hypothetical protein